MEIAVGSGKSEELSWVSLPTEQSKYLFINPLQ
jgi:hypothetical protein